MGKALTVIVLHLEARHFARKSLNAIFHSHHFQRVGACFESRDVDSHIASIGPHQLGIAPGVTGILPSLHIDMIGLCSVYGLPLGIGSLQPTFRLGDGHAIVRDFAVLSLFGSLGKGNTGSQTGVHIAE